MWAWQPAFLVFLGCQIYNNVVELLYMVFYRNGFSAKTFFDQIWATFRLLALGKMPYNLWLTRFACHH